MTKEQETRIKILKDFTKMDFSNPMGWTGYYDTELKELSQAVETVLSMLKHNSAEIEQKNTELAEKNAEIEKKDKQIDLMAEEINETDRGYIDYCQFKMVCDRNCKECIRQYFERKSEE